MTAFRILGLFALIVMLGPGSAHAQPIVYDLTAGPGIPKGLEIGAGTLDVYIDPGSAQTQSGTICEDADGDELCAADVEIVLTGPGEITGFAPSMTGEPIIYEPTSFPPGTTKVRLNLLQSTSPPSPPVPQYLGTVSVDVFSTASPVNKVKVVATGQAVDAGGTLMGISSTELPEPSGSLVMLSGALALHALHRMRTRGSSVSSRDGARSTR